MYKIIKDGEMIAVCETPLYIKVDPETGCYIEATAREADGIAISGVPYSLPNHNLNNQPEVDIQEVNGGFLLMEDEKRITSNSEAIDDIIISLLGG